MSYQRGQILQCQYDTFLCLCEQDMKQTSLTDIMDPQMSSKEEFYYYFPKMYRVKRKKKKKETIFNTLPQNYRHEVKFPNAFHFSYSSA